MVPSLLNAGRSRDRLSAVVSARMPSSVRNSSGSPLRCGIETGTTSSSNTPFFHALAASWWQRAENASCSSRVNSASPALAASVSRPIAWSVNASHRPSKAMWSRIVTSPYLKPSRRLRQQVRRVGHRLLPAGHDDVELAGADQLVGQRDGVDAREADLVDRQRRDGHRDAGLGGRLARGDLPGAGGEDLAHDHVVDLVTADPGPLQGALDRHAAEVGPGEVLEGAQQAAHRRTCSGDDDARGGVGAPGRCAHQLCLQRHRWVRGHV